MAKKNKKYANMDRATALKLAASLLHSFGESSLYDDYAEDEGFTVEQFDQMVAELRKEGPFSIVYEADGKVFTVGPYDTEEDAIIWAKDHSGNGVDSEFDIHDQHVYILGPDHRMIELNAADLGVEDDEEDFPGDEDPELE